MASARPRSGSRIAPTRERIIRAAVHLFQTNGYHGTGLVQILERARAPKGSLYHHFPAGKEALAVAAVEWLRDEVDRFLEPMLQAGAGGRALTMAMASMIAEGLEQPERMRASLISILAQEVVPQSAAIEAALTATLASWQGALAQGFRRDGYAEPELTAQAALAMLEGATILARSQGRRETLVMLVSALLDGRATACSTAS